ncbi:MAG: hypothetical protein ABIX37_05080, partial [Gammaproteobacteria bacterium]
MNATVGGVETATEYSGLEERAKRLRHIAMVTHCVPDLDRAEAAWTGLLGYAVAARGKLAPDLCAAWAAPAAAGQRYCTLVPASGQDSYIRFVETADP